jgi:hypothetical protein
VRQFRFALALGFVLAALGLPLGYVAAQQPNFGQTVGPGSAFNLSVENYLFAGPAVATTDLTGCVTGGSPSHAGTQAFSKVTGGTTAQTTCTVTWPVVWSAAPKCQITGETTPVLTITAMSTTALTWTFASTASTVWDVACFGPR